MDAKWLKYVQRLEDDWSSVADLQRRRRIQNRLSQRARRAELRRKSQMPVPGAAEEATLPSESASQDISIVPSDQPGSSEPSLVRPGVLVMHSLKAVSAMAANAGLLQISCEAGPGFSISPFMVVPEPLRPTPLQELIPHLPYVDVIPIRSVRDKILNSLAAINEPQLCLDLQEGTMMVWGEVAWDPHGWEVSEQFTQRWWFLLDEEVIRTANFWRRQRGEKPLQIAPASDFRIDAF